mgnify:CR=1 FL=1
MQIAGLNNQRVRQHNRHTIMALIWRYKRLSKSQLAQHTGLSIPAVSKILDELVAGFGDRSVVRQCTCQAAGRNAPP